jgi:hypothetical protein
MPCQLVKTQTQQILHTTISFFTATKLNGAGCSSPWYEACSSISPSDMGSSLIVISLWSITKNFNNSTKCYNLLRRTGASVPSLAEHFGDMPFLHHQEMM